MQFLAERIEIAKYSSQDQVDILVSLLHCCLPFNIGKQPKMMSCHIAAVGPRFRLVPRSVYFRVMSRACEQCTFFVVLITASKKIDAFINTCERLYSL